MDTTRDEFPQLRRRATDEERTFKKPYQVVDHPPVTDHDIHEDFMKDPPHNEPTEPSSNRKTRGLKEGATEPVDRKQEGVLGEEATSRFKQDGELATLANENSVHP